MGKHTSTTVVHIYNYGYDGSPQTWTRTDGGVGDCRAGYGSFDPSAASSLTYSKDDEYYVDPTDDTSTDCFVEYTGESDGKVVWWRSTNSPDGDSFDHSDNVAQWDCSSTSKYEPWLCQVTF